MFRDYLIKDGWKFEPSDEKLISKHLKPKTLGEYKGDKEVIGEIDLCKFEPWDLPGLCKSKSDDQVWLFLCPRHFCNNSRRTKRRTKTGQWKPTGEVRSIKDSRTNREIGRKKTLVFYEKASPKDVKKKDVRTGWTIYEYEYLPETNLNVQREFVLVRMVKRDERKSYKGDKGHGKISNVKTHAKSDVQNQTIVNQDYQDTQYTQYTQDNQDNQYTQDTQYTQYTQDNQDNQYTQDNQYNQDNHDQYPYCFGEESCFTSSEFQACNWGVPMVNNSADNQGEVSHYMPYFDNTMQFQNELIPNLDVYSMAFDSVNQNPCKSIASSTIESNWHFSTQNPDTNSNRLILEQRNQRSSQAYFPESEVLEGVAMFPELSPKPLAEFTGDDMDLLSFSENQAPYDNKEVRCPRDSDLVYQPPYSHGEPSSSKATDNENQNKGNNVNVSATQQREKNSLVAATLDSESQNASMSDLLVTGGNYWSPLMASLSENDAQGGNVLTEEQPQLLADWEAFLESIIRF